MLMSTHERRVDLGVPVDVIVEFGEGDDLGQGDPVRLTQQIALITCR
jgi:hypothetical protein